MQAGHWVAGRYRLDAEIGSGGNGTVWRATDQELDRVVALKHALPSGRGPGAERLRLLRREARILARINHPHVVTIFDVLVDDGECWLVMEYVDAPGLGELGKVEPRRAADLGAQLADALAAVHEAGVVHRDIKPSNVLVTADNRAKLGDFGISRVVHGDVTATDTGLLAGTPGYVAPEVASGGEPTPASDVFSLGATLFAAVEGVSPFGRAANPLVLLRRAADGEIAEPTENELTPALSALMAVAPARRPSAADAGRMLHRIAGTPAPARRKSRKGLIAVAAAAIVIVAAASVWLTTGGDDGTAAPAPPAPQPVSLIGDARSADPCALTDSAALTKYGDAHRDPDYGNFDRCDVIVAGADDSEVDVKVQLDRGQAPAGPVQTAGRIGVLREAADGDECDRTLILPGTDLVRVSTQQNGDGQADLCAMAETATGSALAVLNRGPVPRRTTPAAATSLIDVDACSLLDANALNAFPGVDALHPEEGFGGWKCRWNSTTSSSTLIVGFDRNRPLNAEDGRPVMIGGHHAFVEPDEYDVDTCMVEVEHRQFTSVTGSAVVELLQVVITGPQPREQQCDLATSLTAPAVAKLP
ncbi:serine/threonine-protein kinase [Amycolatopsis sp.]|uniref:serine/threonine-protein kinase n=1 Tax=Amycolatopsis sp. TaxID=37632 RepID=UPI002C448E9E|nr:serine/threonine-protein kinase [Amycolatopsis sp.]HVV08885.1 serine/threonine-protein kinase [Amycolatopsis sp.]